MRFFINQTTAWTFFVTGLALLTACLDNPDEPQGGGEAGLDSCAGVDVDVLALIVHDVRDGIVKDSAVVNLNDAANTESASGCDATIALIVGSTRTTLVETRAGQYEAGYSDVVSGLPPLTLTPGAEHSLEIDLGADGSVDVTGVVRLSDIADFRTMSATSAAVTFAWSDSGDVASTVYSAQVSDEQDFVFPDNFASGYVEGTTSIQFGGASEWPYFTAGPPLYARIQSETSGSLSTSGRFTAWEWPVEPILVY